LEEEKRGPEQQIADVLGALRSVQPDGGQIKYAADGLGRRVAKYKDGFLVRG
jgi:hypothetical protein